MTCKPGAQGILCTGCNEVVLRFEEGPDADLAAAFADLVTEKEGRVVTISSRKLGAVIHQCGRSMTHMKVTMADVERGR